MEKQRAITMLLIEDNPGDIRLIQEVMKAGKIKNELNFVNNGEEALMYLRKIGEFANVPRPDIILLDLNLPKKNGREVLAEIKKDPDLLLIPVIVLTSSSEEKDVLETYAQHANCYITKPVDFNQFINVIQSIANFWLDIVILPNHNNHKNGS
jgi:CheY-like chemotaxis protein